MSLSDSPGSPCARPVSILWGCELSGDKRSYTFRVSRDGRDEQQQLVLYTICLAPAARDEFHTVEVTSGDSDNRVWLPIATLKPSLLPMVVLNGLEVTPPVTFRLRAGSGPVHVSGQHVSVMELSSESEWDLDSEDSEESEEDETPERPRRGSRARHNGPAKPRKAGKEEERNGRDPRPAKGRGARRGRKAAPKN